MASSQMTYPPRQGVRTLATCTGTTIFGPRTKTATRPCHKGNQLKWRQHFWQFGYLHFLLEGPCKHDSPAQGIRMLEVLLEYTSPVTTSLVS